MERAKEKSSKSSHGIGKYEEQQGLIENGVLNVIKELSRKRVPKKQ